jgi:hypothetical protein
MALYDVPVHDGFKVLTHTSTRRFAQNGFGQVGNTTLPTNPVNPTPVVRSAIYNKNVSLRGISEAGYGRIYPNYGLSYAGAGSPRSSLRYAGAGSPRTSLRYAGAGSPRSSLRYSGAGSPRGSLLRDAYVNDNPAPGTLGKIGIPGRRNSIRGLADDTVPVDTGSTFGPAAPAPDSSGGILSELGSAFSTLTTTLIGTTATAGTLAANNAVANAIQGTPSTVSQAVTAVKAATNPTTILGISIDTLMIGGIAFGAWYFMKNR